MNRQRADVGDPRRHHLVPRWYLRRFANERDQLRVLDLRNQKRYLNNVNSVAVEVGFYDLVTGNGVSLDAETLLSVVESEAATAMRQIDNGFENLTDYNREKLAMFVAVQFLRGEDRRDFGEAITDMLGKSHLVGMSKESVRGAMQEQGGVDPSEEEVERQVALFRNRDAYVVRSPGGHIKTMVSLMIPTTQFLVSEFKWQIWEFPVPALPTSDSPVRLWRKPDSGPEWMGVGIATCDEIRLPIAPNRVLVLVRDEDANEGLFRGDVPAAGEACLSAMNSAYRGIYFHPDSPLGTTLDIPRSEPSFPWRDEVIEMVEKIREVNE